MPAQAPNKKHRPRELRRRVLVRARVLTPGGWADACILNVSSRGLLIQTLTATPPGSVMEVHHRDYAFVTRVVWRSGARVGLCAEERLPVDDMLLVSSRPMPEMAVRRGSIERRKAPRDADQNRLRARAFEFVSIAIIGTSLAGGLVMTVNQALARPLALVEATLGR